MVSIWDNPGYKLRIEDVKMKQMQHVKENVIKDDRKCYTDIRSVGKQTPACVPSQNIKILTSSGLALIVI